MILYVAVGPLVVPGWDYPYMNHKKELLRGLWVAITRAARIIRTIAVVRVLMIT